MFGPVLRVGVPLDWICHLDPVSSDVQLQKEGSLAQPKSQANHRKAVQGGRIHRTRQQGNTLPIFTIAVILMIGTNHF
jgi:hypothetical protein